MWISSIFLSLTTVLSIISIFYSSGLFWLGMKKISFREHKNQNNTVLKQNLNKRVEILNNLNLWWDQEHFSRNMLRKLFVSTFLFFTNGFILMSSMWCNNCILGIILFTIFSLGNICVLILSKKFILIDDVNK